jgi:hypothetical protein
MNSEADKKVHFAVLSRKDGAPLDMRSLGAIIETGSQIAGERP